MSEFTGTREQKCHYCGELYEADMVLQALNAVGVPALAQEMWR